MKNGVWDLVIEAEEKREENYVVNLRITFRIFRVALDQCCAVSKSLFSKRGAPDPHGLQSVLPQPPKRHRLSN